MRSLDRTGWVIVVVIGILLLTLIWIWTRPRLEPESETEPAPTEDDITDISLTSPSTSSATWHHILIRKNRYMDEKYVFVVNKLDNIIEAKVYQFRNGALIQKPYHIRRDFVDRGEKLFHNKKLSIGVKNHLETYFIHYDQLRFESEAKYKAKEVGTGIYLSYFDSDPKYWGYIIYTQGDETQIKQDFKRTIASDTEGELIIIDTDGGQFGYLTTYELDHLIPEDSSSHRTIHYYV